MKKLDNVKIFGERNSGTKILEHVVSCNFDCKIISGIDILTDEQLAVLDSTINSTSYFEKKVHRQALLDDLMEERKEETLGWKHSCPPLDLILNSPRSEDTLFLIVTKSPFDWLKSFHVKPYHKLYEGDYSFSEFIRHFWICTRRDNTDRLFLDNPVHLFNLKMDAYLNLINSRVNVVHIKYYDFLFHFDETMNCLSNYLCRKSNQWEKPEESSFKFHQEKYSKPMGVSDSDALFIEGNLNGSYDFLP